MREKLVDTLSQYANYCGLPIAGSDAGNLLNLNYQWFVANITNKNAIIAILLNDGYYKTHAVCFLGIEQNTSGDYLRIVDGKTTILNTWYKYKNSLYAALYVRWS